MNPWLAFGIGMVVGALFLLVFSLMVTAGRADERAARHHERRSTPRNHH